MPLPGSIDHSISPFALFVRALCLLWALAVCPLAGLLFATALTLPGWIFSIGALLLGIAPAIACVGMGPLRFRRAAWVPFAGWLLITAGLALTAPNGRTRDGARVQNRYSDGGWHYQRFALGALLPEIDQLRLGFTLMPAADPLFSMQQSREIRDLTRTIYKDLEADADFHALGSVMPDVYDDLWFRHSNRGHYFLYVPPNLDRTTPAPVLIFLHGFGGNFKAYTWLLSRVADERGMVIIAPSFGTGSWDAEHGVHTVLAALNDAAKAVQLDMDQVHLAGLSNGGLGVSYLAASDAGKLFRSLIFLSPVFDEAALGSRNFWLHWRDKPVLIVTGEKDNRVPLPYVLTCAKIMRSTGAKVDMTTYSDADHLLIFSHRDEFLEQLSAWVKLHSTTAAH
jgi:pimeloyl-ACP methyl ester carboxylesterase